MNPNLKLLGVSLAASMMLAGLAGCELPGAVGGKDGQQTDGHPHDQTAKNVHEGTISKDETWKKADGPHIIRGEVLVESDQGVTLTIEAGTEVRFEKGASLYIGYGGLGYLKAQGTVDKPILFTSASANPSKGDWMTIYLGNGAANSVMVHCKIAYGGTDSYGALTVSGANNTPTFTNCTIEQSAGYGIDLQDSAAFKVFTGNTIKTSGSNPIRMGANEVGSLGTGNTFVENTHQAIAVQGEYITKSATWLNHGIPYRIQGETVIESESAVPVLTIAAGNTLEFGSGANLYVGHGHAGALYAVGTSENPIMFTGVSKSAGSWSGLNINQYAVDGIDNDESTTVIQHATIEYGETSNGSLLYIDNSKPLLKNVTFQFAGGKDAIYVDGTPSGVPEMNALVLNNTFGEGVSDLMVNYNAF